MKFYKVRTKDKLKTYKAVEYGGFGGARNFADFRALRTHKII